MVLTLEQKLSTLLCDESQEDTEYNVTARHVVLERIYSEMVHALPTGLTAQPPNSKTFNPSFLIDVCKDTILYNEFGITQLSLIVASDRMSNRIRDGVNATQRKPPKCFEIGLMKHGHLSYDHPMTEGDAIASFHADHAYEALQWMQELLLHSPTSQAADDELWRQVMQETDDIQRAAREAYVPLPCPLKRDDIVFLSGLANRTDLNVRLGKALGRTNTSGDREGVELLGDKERIWVRRANLRSVPTVVVLDGLQKLYPTLPEADVANARALL